MKKIVSLLLTAAMLLSMAVVSTAYDDAVTVQSVHFYDASGSEVTGSIDGSVYAAVTFAGISGTKTMITLAAYEGNRLTAASVAYAAAGSTQTVNIPAVTMCADGTLKLLVWSDTIKPYTKTIVPKAEETVPLKGFAVTMTKNNVTQTWYGDINPERRQITLDLPASCATQASAKTVYDSSDVTALTPQLTLAEGWSCIDDGARDFTQSQIYTFTKDGEEPVTYTAAVEWSDLGRTSGFESGIQITASSADSGALAAFKSGATADGSRQYTHWGGHYGGGFWRQIGYLETADDNGVYAVDEANTYGSISLTSGVAGNSSKLYQITKTKIGSKMEMTNFQQNSNGTNTTSKYRLSADLCMDNITGGEAYMMASANGGASFVKNGNTYDLYYRSVSGEQTLLKRGALQEDTWHKVTIVGRINTIGDVIWETMEFYLDGVFACDYMHEVSVLNPISSYNIKIGMSSDALGKLSYDNWCATDIELSPEANPVVWIIGDSLVQDYSTESITRGWGTYLPDYLDRINVLTYNLSVAGSVSKDYLETDGKYAAKWAIVTENIKPEDVLLIALGYNEPNQTTYGTYLKEFAETALNAGAEPVFVTQPVQLNIEGTALENSRQASINTMKTVCSENGYFCLDLNAKWWDLLEDKTIDEAKTYYEGVDGIDSNHPTGDWLHFREKGAVQNAEFIAELAEESDSILKNYLKNAYNGRLTSFTLNEQYEAKIQGNKLFVSLPGEIGGAMPESDLPDVDDMMFTYTSEDGTLAKADATHYILTGANGRSRTYTLIPEYYTALIDMNFDDTVIDKDGHFPNYPATNALGVQNGGGAPAAWYTSGSGGTVTAENGAIKLNKSTTGQYLGVQIQNIEYPAETQKISAKFNLKIDSLNSETNSQMQIAVGENVPWLQMTNQGLADGYYSFLVFSGWDNSAISVENMPQLKVGQAYDFELLFEKDDDKKVTMTMTVDGKTVTAYVQHDVNRQMILFPQFKIRANNNSLMTAYLDDVEVSYVENTLKDKKKVFLVSDSICYTYPAHRTAYGKKIQGWGKILQDRIDSEKFTVINSAKEGSATSIFLYGGQQKPGTDHRYDLPEAWSFISKRLNTGDYVIIGLAWNESGYSSEAAYKANLITMINDIKAKGANPILVTPTVACNMTTYAISNSRESWAEIMKNIAKEEEGVVCLDLNSTLYEVMTAATNAQRESYYTDGTHYTPEGAKLVGDAICDLLEASESPLKEALLKEDVLTDTASDLVTFNDYTAGTNAESLSDSRFVISRNATAAKAGDITIENDPAVNGTRGKVMKIVTYAGNNNNDTINFKMASGSGKSTITAEMDLYIESMNTTAYGDYRFTFEIAMLTINSLPIGIRNGDSNASWRVRSDMNALTPDSTICDNALELGKWYTLKVVYHTETGLSDYYVNGELLLKDDPNYRDSHKSAAIPTSTTGIRFFNLYSGDATYYIDNVTLTAE